MPIGQMSVQMPPRAAIITKTFDLSFDLESLVSSSKNIYEYARYFFQSVKPFGRLNPSVLQI